MNEIKNEKRLRELIELMCDDRLDGDTTDELESILSSDPSAIEYYVESVDLHTRLHRQQGVVGLAQPPLSPGEDFSFPPSSSQTKGRRLLGFAMAVCISLVLGTLAGWQFSSSSVLPTTRLLAEHQTIATLSSAQGCRWSDGERARYDGQRLINESLDLETGVATIRFDSDVILTIEGPTRLDLVSVNRARLLEGKAAFRGVTDLDAFTLETPFSNILDEGTEYAVLVSPTDKAMEVHVFDGRVQCETGRVKENPVRVEAGQARRFAASGTDLAIPLEASRFIREPQRDSLPRHDLMLAESFDYVSNFLGDQENGIGWAGAWEQLNAGKANAFNDFEITDSIAWPGRPASTTNGSLRIAGNTALRRMMKRPIRMDQDGAYYLSFLVRRNQPLEQSMLRGWAFLTLRSPQGNKIAISSRSLDGPAKLIHNGRTAKGSVKLEDETDYLFVVKILAQKEQADQVFVQVYGTDEVIDDVEPLSWSVASGPIFDDSVMDQLRIVSRASQPIQVDDIRLGKTWAAVTGDVAF